MIKELPDQKYRDGQQVSVTLAGWYRVSAEAAEIIKTDWSVTFGCWSYLLQWTDGKKCWFCERQLEIK